MEYVIQLKNVEYTYPDGTKALKGVNISIEKGEKVAVMGENGSGKSTLFKILNGTLKPTKGSILIDGKPVEYNKKGLLEVRKKIGFVFQDADDQLFSADVRQDISFGLFNLGLNEEQVKEKVDSIIRYFNMESFAKKPVQFLSGGQKKRVAISDVVVMEPKVILFDEPAAGMDATNVNILDEILEKLHERSKTLLVSTHDSHRAFEFSNRIILMKDGRIIEDGSPEKVLIKTEALKETNIAEPYVVTIFKILKEKNLIKENIEEIPKNMEEFQKILK